MVNLKLELPYTFSDPDVLKMLQSSFPPPALPPPPMNPYINSAANLAMPPRQIMMLDDWRYKFSPIPVANQDFVIDQATGQPDPWYAYKHELEQIVLCWCISMGILSNNTNTNKE